MPKRFDSQRLDKAERTPQGYLRAPAAFTRVGVFNYRKADGSIQRELRPADEVMKAESLAGLRSTPITNEHPEGLLDSKNTKEHLIGFTGDSIEQDEDLVCGTVTITDESAIREVENGKAELSCGYECDLAEEPGEFNGIPYDLVQKNIVYNHVSLVARGRAGPRVRLKLDADDAELTEEQPKPQEVPSMEKIQLNGKEFECTPELAAEIKALQSKLAGQDSAQAEALKQKETQFGQEKQALDNKVGELSKSNEQLQAKVDSLTEDLKTRKDSAAPSDEQIRKMVKERTRLEKVAGVVCPEAKLDEMGDLDVMKTVIKAKADKFDGEGKSPEYIRARFDHIAEGVEATFGSIEKLSAATSKRNDSTELKTDSAAARKRMIEESHTQWQQPLATTKKEA